MQGIWKQFLALLVLISVAIWLAVIYYPEPKLHLIACDVGQGDAILAVYGKTQILVDGGPNNRVLDCLSNNLPFWDREIELVILTHPQTDHYTGLIEVFRRYTINKLLANPIDSGAQAYQVLKDVVGGSGTEVVYPTSGMVIRLGLMYLDILHPSDALISSKSIAKSDSLSAKVLGTRTTAEDPNDFSIVAILTLGKFDALLTGDIGPAISDLVAEKLAVRLPLTIEYIKVPHHGSKNGLSSYLLNASDPEIAVISAGKNNRYGHPHQEVLEMLSGYELRVLRTDEMGDVEVITDGKSWLIE